MENKLSKYLKTLWKSDYPASAPEEAEVSWERFSEKVFEKKQPKVFQLKTRWKYCAAAAVLLLIIALPFATNSGTDFVLVENTTQKAKKITLPDNSTVILQPETKFYYAKNFHQNRTTKLTGEAFFEVRKDKNVPFTVSCNKTTTTVLGTSFSVKSLYSGTMVALYEGSVQMNIDNNTQDWQLFPGDLFVYYQEKTEIKTFDKTIDPTKSHIDFDNVQLTKVINYINKVYGYTIKINKALLNEKVTLRIRKNESLANVMNTIAAIYDLNSEINHQQKEIKLFEKQ